jgi:hypothetical protein
MYAWDGIAERRLLGVSRWVIAAGAVGLPITLGFAGRWLLYRELYAFRLYGVLAVCVVASALATGALLGTLGVRPPAKRRGVAAAVAVAVLAAIELAGGVRFSGFNSLLSRTTGQALPSAIADLWYTVTSPLTVVNGLLLTGAILVPPIAAYLLRRSPRTMGTARRRALRRALRLTLIAEGAARMLVRLGEVAQRSTGLLESRRAMAWTLMAVIVTGGAVIVAEGAGGPESHAPPVPALVMFAIAAALSAMLVLRESPAATLSALGASYVVSAAVLVAAGTQPVVAGTKVLVGALVVAILAISMVPASDGDDRTGAARRLLAATSTRSGTTLSTLGVALALAAGLILSLGLHTGAVSALVPDALLHPALALVVGGVITAVFARTPLRVAAGVLFALAGAEVISTSLDPGLIITGGLAAFQLLVAVVAAYYIGEHVSRSRGA